jgi:hypothetical protein
VMKLDILENVERLNWMLIMGCLDVLALAWIVCVSLEGVWLLKGIGGYRLDYLAVGSGFDTRLGNMCYGLFRALEFCG